MGAATRKLFMPQAKCSTPCAVAAAENLFPFAFPFAAAAFAFAFIVVLLVIVPHCVAHHIRRMHTRTLTHKHRVSHTLSQSVFATYCAMCLN